MNEEQYLHDQLRFLHEQYEKAAKPYIERLAAIQANRNSISMTLTLAEAERLGFNLTNTHPQDA
jgi:hypothetical protein